jgi:translation initiation factor 4G
LQLSEDSYADRCLILKRFLDVDIDREQQALFALQALMHELEHPNKLLATIFFALYNNDVISEDGFEAWLNYNDSDELEGKGVATKSTNTFFTWMRENEGEEED